MLTLSPLALGLLQVRGPYDKIGQIGLNGPLLRNAGLHPPSSRANVV